jgi:drug/metabolite transporter (DMT)-like permease
MASGGGLAGGKPGVASSRGLGIAAIAACAFLWSTAGILVKLVPWHPLTVAGGRSLVAALFLLAVIRRPRFTFSAVQIGAALANATTMLLFIAANKETTAANAILLQYGAPIYVALLGGPILKEKARAEHWIALVAIALGMVMFFAGGLGGGRLLGDALAVASGLSFALYILLMRAQKDGSPLESVLLSHLLTAAVGLGATFLLPAPSFSPAALGAILALGLLQIGLASILFAWGIRRASAVEGVLVAVVEPIFNPVWVFLFVGELPGTGALAGGALIIAAVVVSSIVSIRRDAAGPAGSRGGAPAKTAAGSSVDAPRG